MARSVTGLFADKTHTDHILGALTDAGFDPARISVTSPDGAADAPAQAPVSSHSGIGSWLIDHLRGRGVSNDHAKSYQQRVSEGRHLVSVEVINDTEDGEARGLMVSIGAEEISSAADGTMHPVG
jgi:hypothetical protein